LRQVYRGFGKLMQQRRLSMILFLLVAAAFLPLETHALDTETILDTGTIMEEAARYQHGEGVDRDYARAYRLYCIAALQGDAEAAYQLGWMYLNGRGMPADDALAAGWFQLAAERGDPQSQRILDDLLTGVEPEEDSGCPLRDRQPDLVTIETWVNILAPSYGLDANLLLAVIEVESGFNPAARSSKDARGLMQLLPTTARRFAVEDIHDPFENLLGGMAYLRWLLDHYGGDLDLSLAAYNAGEDVVERYGGIPPYTETRYYVKTINRIYKQAIPSRPTSATDITSYIMTATQ
jgi:hypothetical protein